jgi:hypothetical protein
MTLFLIPLKKSVTWSWNLYSRGQGAERIESLSKMKLAKSEQKFWNTLLRNLSIFTPRLGSTAKRGRYHLVSLDMIL